MKDRYNTVVSRVGCSIVPSEFHWARKLCRRLAGQVSYPVRRIIDSRKCQLIAKHHFNLQPSNARVVNQLYRNIYCFSRFRGHCTQFDLHYSGCRSRRATAVQQKKAEDKC